MAVFIHVANVLYLFSYLVRDILWLRLLTIVAALMLMPYFYFRSEILWPPILWNILFISINAYQTYRLLLARRPIELTEVEQRIYSCCFPALTPRQFKSLHDVASQRSVAQGKTFIAKGAQLGEVMMVYEGGISVLDGGAEVAALGPGSLVGEMSFVTGKPAGADVAASSETTLLAWPHSALKTLFEDQPELRSQWQRIMIGDLSAKLRPVAASAS